jgi:hypothetical protein
VVATERGRQLSESVAEPEVALTDQTEVRHHGLTRREVLQAKAAYYADGHKSTAIHDRLNVSRSTLRRARMDFDLIPWPKNEPSDGG